MSTLIVAEAGVNHNGKVEIALELIRYAKMYGFDAVKFQKRNQELYPETPKKSAIIGDCTYREHKRALELSEEDYITINDYCNEIGIEWFASCFDEESVVFMSVFKPNYWKIASCSVTDLDLVGYIAAQEGHVIISTGMCTMPEADAAIGVLHEVREGDFSILHCCGEYPTPIDHVNLNMIPHWKQRTIDKIRIGYSDHTATVAIPAASVLLGAEIVEVHVTLDRAMPGSDQSASVGLVGMETLVRHIRGFEKAMGYNTKHFYPAEKEKRESMKMAVSDEKNPVNQ